MFKVIVAGTRTFNDIDLLNHNLIQFLKGKRPSEITIVSGCAKGADTLGEKFAESYNIKIAKFPADWKKFKKSAGHIRNEDMARYADACIVFWDGESRGTESMIDLAKKYGLILEVVMY